MPLTLCDEFELMVAIFVNQSRSACFDLSPTKLVLFLWLHWLLQRRWLCLQLLRAGANYHRTMPST